MDADRVILRQPGERHQVLRRHVLAGAHAGGGEVELAGVRADRVDELGGGPVRRIALDEADVRVQLDQRQHRPVVPLVGHLRFERRHDRVRRDARDEQRVAVGGRVPHRHRADHAGGAGAVHRHDRLVVEVLRRVLADVAAREVRVAAGGERDDEGDRLGRVALRERLRPRQCQRCDQRDSCHLAPPPFDAGQSTAGAAAPICSRR